MAISTKEAYMRLSSDTRARMTFEEWVELKRKMSESRAKRQEEMEGERQMMEWADQVFEEMVENYPPETKKRLGLE